MNDDDFKDLPDDQLKLIDDICSEFDRNLQTGKICAVDELTSHAPQELQPHIQEELVATEIDFCRQKNDELSAEELQRRFPKVRLAKVEELLQESAATADDTANLEVTQVGIEHQGATSSTGLQQIGPYRLEEEIGRGGMGVVYRAVHTKLGKTVALKVLSVSIAVHEEAVARFQREMLAIGAFEHPNIVRATDAGEINGLHYLVMEFVRGADLTSLTRRGLLPPTEAAEIIRQAAIGLQAAFAQGMVHRDIKPSNVMLAEPVSADTAPTVKILDLGLAQLGHDVAQKQAELSGSDAIIGTVAYMAPEQADNSRVDIRADIYSLGCTLYRLLTGGLPFSQDEYESPLKLMIAKATKEAPSVGSIRNDLPAKLVKVVDRMVHRDPAQRFTEPSSVAAALAPFAEEADLSGLLVTVKTQFDAEPQSAAKLQPGDATTLRKGTGKPLLVKFFLAGCGVVAAAAGLAVLPPFHSAETSSFESETSGGNGENVGKTDVANESETNGPPTIPDIDSGSVLKLVSSPLRLGQTSSVDAAAADFDEDGDLDLVVAASGPVTLYWNEGDGQFRGETIDVVRSWTSVATGDVNSDGLDDIFLTSAEGVNVIWLNQGGHRFLFDISTIGLTNGDTVGGELHDLDGDDDLDIFLAVQGPNVVYLNDGTGRFTQADFEFPSSHSTDAQIADFDSDGRADIIVSNHGPNRVWLNEGNATFREFGPGMKDCATSSICVGDVDGDGDLDFVSANNGSQTNFVWSNDGHGFFSPIGTIGAEDSTNEIALADLDNDGDLDAVVGNWAENKESLLSQQSFAWMNDGNGVFTDSIAVLDEPTRVAGILTVDLDNNGLPDVFVSNWAEEPDRIIMNRTDSRTARRFDGQQNSIHVPGIPHSDEIN